MRDRVSVSVSMSFAYFRNHLSKFRVIFYAWPWLGLPLRTFVRSFVLFGATMEAAAGMLIHSTAIKPRAIRYALPVL